MLDLDVAAPFGERVLRRLCEEVLVELRAHHETAEELAADYAIALRVTLDKVRGH